jgi:AcrR family transcriptional regulator
MSGQKTRRLPPGERRRQLLELGIELSRRQPLEAISIQAVAERAGISPGLLYHYFPSKREFHRALLSELAVRMESASRWDLDLGFGAALSRSLSARIAFATAYPTVHRVLVGTGSDPGLEVVRERVRRTDTALLLRGIGVSRTSPGLRTAVRAWLGFRDAAILDWIEHRDLPETELLGLLERTLRVALERSWVPNTPAPEASTPAWRELTPSRRKPRIRLVTGPVRPSGPTPRR